MPPVHADARILRATTADRGLCPSCGLTAFLKDLPATQLGIERAGGIGPLLAAPHIRQGILAMMRTGNADVGPEEIDWERIARNWELPDARVPGRKGGRRG